MEKDWQQCDSPAFVNLFCIECKYLKINTRIQLKMNDTGPGHGLLVVD